MKHDFFKHSHFIFLISTPPPCPTPRNFCTGLVVEYQWMSNISLFSKQVDRLWLISISDFQTHISHYPMWLNFAISSFVYHNQEFGLSQFYVLKHCLLFCMQSYRNVSWKLFSYSKYQFCSLPENMVPFGDETSW